MLLGLGLAAIALIFIFAIGEPYMHREVPRPIDPMAIVVLVLGSGIFASVLLGPLGKAIGRMIETLPRSDDLASLRLEELESRIASIEHRGMTSGEVELQFARLAEVEERLDFAERLLTTNDAAGPEKTR